jgi:hypothetical protein
VEVSVFINTSWSVYPVLLTRWPKIQCYFGGGLASGFGKYHSVSQAGVSSPVVTDINSKGVNVNLIAGVNYFITNRFALECNVGSISWQRGTATEVDTNYNRVSNTLDLQAG